MALSLDGTTGISASGNIVGNNISVSGTLTAGAFSPVSLSASGNITAGNLATSGKITSTATAAPTADIVTITNAGQPITTAGVNALQVTYVGGAAAVEAAGTRVDITPGGTTGGTWSAFRVTPSAGAATGVTMNGVKFDNVTGAGGTDNALNCGTGWDNILIANGVSIINGTGVVQSAAISGSYTGITAVGTLTSLNSGAISSSGNVTGANLVTGGLITATGNVTGGNINTGGVVSSTGNVQAGNLRTAGLISSTGNITGGNLSGTNISGTLTTASQTNITAVGTLTSLNSGAISSSGNVTGANLVTGGLITATGNITGGNLSVANGTVTLGNVVNNNSNGVGNIGSATTYFNTVFAKATSAQYADVAEKYQADDNYPAGTVLVFGGQREVTVSCVTHDSAVAGTVSENPSYIMNAGLDGDNIVTVALLGRVPCRVIGDIQKGDLLVSSDRPGVAIKLDPSKYRPGSIIGKALENHTGDQESIIEIVVGRV